MKLSGTAAVLQSSPCGPVALVLLVVSVLGCGQKRPPEVYPAAASRDAIQRSRDILALYAAGQPVGSESIGFPVMVDDVRKIDVGVADLLERGFAEITSRPAAAQATAERLLEQIPDSAAAAAAAAGLGPAP